MAAKTKATAPAKDDWEAESDAHTLAQAEAIKADKRRMGRAAKAAKKLADEQAEKAKAMKKIARKSPPKKAGKRKR